MFTSIYTEKWAKSKYRYVPHSTPSFKYVPIIENKEFGKVYCEYTLFLHNPDYYPNNILGEHETVEIALNTFVKDPRCLEAVKNDY